MSEFEKEIDFALRQDQYEDLIMAISDAIQAQGAFGNHKRASEYGKIQKVLHMQKIGQERILNQAKEVININQHGTTSNC